MQLALPLDGHCCGPLFAPPVKVRAPKPHRGPERVRQVLGRTPPWVSRNQVLRVYAWSSIKTAVTGVQHSVDHVVPINHPLVCGLHCPANLRVVPLAENIRKSNNWWPDMPEVQGNLLTVNNPNVQ